MSSQVNDRSRIGGSRGWAHDDGQRLAHPLYPAPRPGVLVSPDPVHGVLGSLAVFGPGRQGALPRARVRGEGTVSGQYLFSSFPPGRVLRMPRCLDQRRLLPRGCLLHKAPSPGPGTSFPF